MATSTDFPAHCPTNVHILHDFAEIAYIVCTHAIPASADNLTDANSPEKILERLRNAEKQFRQNSILVALDAEKFELFTFYRKVDVVKDQRTILNKFGYVCRLNSCIISSKSAARVLELLKPESSRIYKLFTSAVLSSIQISPRSSGSTIAIGTRVYLVPIAGEHEANLFRDTETCPEWQIYRVNLQVIASGQLVLIVQHAKSGRVRLLSDMERVSASKDVLKGTLLYLVPVGQMARYPVGLTGTKVELADRLKSTPESSHAEIKSTLVQIDMVTEWFNQQHPTCAADLRDETCWVQVEIAVLEAANAGTNASDRKICWKTLMWPLNLIFVFPHLRENRSVSKQSAVDVDPLAFALDWIDGNAEKHSHSVQTHACQHAKEETDDEYVFSDEARFGDQYNPQVFGPPTFPAGQMVYPTPPEAMAMHQTPGMMSVDGLAPTPAPNLTASQQSTGPFLDQEMLDIQEPHHDRIGTGFYDEDLFDEVPEDKFAPSADADEPNWDFFDAPGFGASENEPDDLGDTDNQIEAHNDYTTNGDEFPTIESLAQGQEGKNSIDEDDFSKTSPEKIDDVYVSGLTMSPTALHQDGHVGKPLLTQNIDAAVANEALQRALDQQPVYAYHTRRRSSVFEGIPFNMGSKDHDSRYHKHGKFWFDNEQHSRTRNMRTTHTEPEARPSSSGSDTSMSSSASGSNISLPLDIRRSPIHKRTWTEYQPQSPLLEQVFVDDVDHKQIEADVENLLAVIGTSSGEDPFFAQSVSLSSPHKQPNYTPPKTLMVAQMLVDQVSQASLLRSEYQLQLDKDENPQIDVSMDHSGARSLISHATLADLTCIPPRTIPRVSNMSNRLICAQRSENEILARQSILAFWDTLGLQPYSGTKDIVAYCICPKSTNVSDGCLTFLSRLADTYSSSNLGSHSIGRLSGLTNNGLVTWTPQLTSGSNLRQVCQRFGSSIGGGGSTAHTTIVVYMVSPSKDAICYREICHAFTILFEAFMDTAEGVQRDVELVLQIVPIDFVASPDTLAIPDQTLYLELALEVYNRVPMKRLEVATASCGSAVILEERRLRDPTFELTSATISPLSKDGPCLHLAYSYSTDKKWLTAAWTDERGLVAFTMSYCLNVTPGGRSHSRREVYRSIWDISHDIMGRSRVKWRLVVARVGFYEVEDITEWQLLVSQGGDDRKLMSRLILVSIDLNPDLSIENLVAAVKPAPLHPTSQVHNLLGTPVTTPQANMTSPDQIVAATPTSSGVVQAHAPSPPDHNFEPGHEVETMLTDPTDQTWAVLLAFGLNQSSNLLDIRPAAASGLLVKRTSSKDDSKALRLLGVNLVAAPRSQPTSLALQERESILQEMMEQFRGLVTLAASRGCVDKSSECVPWHVATVLKGSRVLSEAM